MAEDASLLDNVPDTPDHPDPNSEAAQAASIDHMASTVEDRPEWLPEKFYDPKKGAKYEDLAKSYGELEKQFRAGKHKAPEDGNYDIKLFAEKGVKDDDPALAAYKGWAKEYGISQQAFDALAGTVLGMAGENAEQSVVNLDEERKSLGPNADAIIKGMADWGRGLVRKGVWSKEDYDEFRVFAGTAGGIKAAMKLREAYEGRIPDMRAVPTESGMSEDDLKSMVADPRYAKDPAYRAKVERAFEQFYGDKAA